MYYIENVDMTQHPGTVLEARCRCSGCLTIPELLLYN